MGYLNILLTDNWKWLINENDELLHENNCSDKLQERLYSTV